VPLRRGLVPGFDRAVAITLLRHALPVAVALTMNVIYFRVLMIMTSLLASQTATGYFATSFQVFAVLFSLPLLVLSTALPLLSVAGRDDDSRLAFGLQKMTEVSLAASVVFVLVIFVLAPTLIPLLGGDQYRGAVPVLRIQSFALIAVFVGQVWQLGLLSLRRQAALAWANAGALAIVLALGGIVIPLWGANGAAAAAVVSETCLAVLVYLFLRRTAAAVAPRAGLVPRVIAAALPAFAVLALPAAVGDRARACARGLWRCGVAVARHSLRADARPAQAMTRPRIVLLRGHSANPWELRAWELLTDRYDVRVLTTGSNAFDLGTLELPVEHVGALRDRLPRGRAGDLGALVLGDRYLGLAEALRGADVVHAAEIGVPYSHGPALLKKRLGFRLVLTVWETIPFGDAYRQFRGRRQRRETIPRVDLFLAANRACATCAAARRRHGGSDRRCSARHRHGSLHNDAGAPLAPRSFGRPSRLGERTPGPAPRPRVVATRGQ